VISIKFLFLGLHNETRMLNNIGEMWFVQERLGFFAFAMSTTFYTCADALPVFLQERYIFMRETATNAYRKSSYVLAHAIIYVPFLAVLSIAFCMVVWWAVGLAGGGSGFLFFFLIVWASFWAGNSFVTLLSAVMPNVMLGYTVVVAILAYFLLLSGFFISRLRIPIYWRWFHYLSIIKYPFEAVLINEFENTKSCYEIGREMLHGTPLANLDESVVDNILVYIRSLPALRQSSYANLNPTTCILTGPNILLAKEITELSKWACLGVTIGFGIFFRCIFYVILRILGKNKRD
jgi:ABC-type multidrug transport system permease subunit